MQIPVPSNKERFRIKMQVKAVYPFYLMLKGYDPTKPNTFYFRKKVPFYEEDFKKGIAHRNINIPLPLSPTNMMLELYDHNEKTDHNFQIKKFKVEKLEPREIWAEEAIHRFIPFALNFAEKAGYANTGFYDTPDKEFLIQYLPIIKDDLGTDIITPARTNRKTGRIQVSQSDFVKHTIPIRFMILMHERFHYQIPTRKEKLPDLCALKRMGMVCFTKSD